MYATGVPGGNWQDARNFTNLGGNSGVTSTDIRHHNDKQENIPVRNCRPTEIDHFYCKNMGGTLTNHVESEGKNYGKITIVGGDQFHANLFGVGISPLVTLWREFSQDGNCEPLILRDSTRSLQEFGPASSLSIMMQQLKHTFYIIFNYPKILSTTMWYVSRFDFFLWILRMKWEPPVFRFSDRACQQQECGCHHSHILSCLVKLDLEQILWNMRVFAWYLDFKHGSFLAQRIILRQGEKLDAQHLTLQHDIYLVLSSSGTKTSILAPPLLHMLCASAGQQRKHVLTADLAK